MTLNRNPHGQVQEGLETQLTEREYELLSLCKEIIPDSFKREADDWRILAFIDAVIGDINYVPPLTNYDINTIPTFFDTIIKLGTNAWVMYFVMQKWSLEDFNYSNNGLTVALDRVGKIKTPADEFMKQYHYKTKAVKMNKMSKIVLASPRNQAVLGQFLRVTLGEGYGGGR